MLCKRIMTFLSKLLLTLTPVKWIVLKLIEIERTLKMNNVEFLAAIEAVTVQVNKVKAEVLAKVSELEAAVTAAGVPSPEVIAKFEALKAAVNAADAVIPDVPAPAPVEPVTE